MTGVGALLAKVVLAMLAFPPIYILAKYLRWCSKHDAAAAELEKEEEEA